MDEAVRRVVMTRAFFFCCGCSCGFPSHLPEGGDSHSKPCRKPRTRLEAPTIVLRMNLLRDVVGVWLLLPLALAVISCGASMERALHHKTPIQAPSAPSTDRGCHRFFKSQVKS